jgi:nucleotide sugar dehydrogenase
MDKQLYRPVVAVVGVGYVGTHLVEAFAKVYTVVAFDVSEQRVEQLPRQYQGHPAVRSTSHAPDLADADAFLISVPTLLKEDKTIDTSFVEGAIQTIAQHARDGVTVVVESSVAVGMTRKLLSPLIAANKVKVGMSPEVCCHTPFYRIQADIATRGSTRVPAFETIPKIISGIDPPSLEAVHQLYSPVFHHLVPVSSLEVAEMTKLYENCQRMVCATYANEMADACASMGIDGWEVSRAAASKPFGYLPFRPGPGVGGHCIPVNPYYLFQGCDMPILRHATEVANRRPAEIADRLVRVLEKKTRVLVVGVGFKRGQSQLCNSPGVAVIQSLLRDHKLDVEFADPLVGQEALPYVPKLDTAVGWNKDYLEGRFGGVLVALDQVGLDMNVIDSLEGVVVHDYSPRSTVRSWRKGKGGRGYRRALTVAV